jgi:hypothetical protein
MKLVKVLVTPIMNLKDLLKAIEPVNYPMSSFRELLVDSLMSSVIESIYRDLYDEPMVLTTANVIDSYDEVLMNSNSGYNTKLNEIISEIDVNEILKQLNLIKDQIIYVIATEGSLSNSTFHTHIISSNAVKILIYDISPITRSKR